MGFRLFLCCAFLGFCLICLTAYADSQLRPSQVVVVVNSVDSASLEVGRYYLRARNIPEKNLVSVSIPGSPKKLSLEQFKSLKEQIDDKLTPEIQVVVMVWTTPYAVECNSITSAFSLGFNAAQCQNTCAAGTASKYFNSTSTQPFRDMGIRLSMMLPTENVEKAKALIDRGVLSGFRQNEAGAYLLVTSDKNRNSRAGFFPRSVNIPQKGLEIHRIEADSIENKKDIMFYLTGMVTVPKLETLGFLPGALADHLTSFGGELTGGSQMSSLKWLDAGATASYGSVSEPCNHWQKFPNPVVLIQHYLSGDTAIEAYWRSVLWPAQGVFIGEPLAAPYCSRCGLNLEPSQ